MWQAGIAAGEAARPDAARRSAPRRLRLRLAVQRAEHDLSRRRSAKTLPAACNSLIQSSFSKRGVKIGSGASKRMMPRDAGTRRAKDRSDVV